MSLAELDPVWKALSDPTRREILDLIHDRAMTTGELCDHFKKLDRCTVMKHLAILVDARLVLIRREGRLRWNYLNPVPIRQIYERWITPYVGATASSMIRLKQHVEGKTRSNKRRKQ